MPRGRRKGRGGMLLQFPERQGSQDSSGPPRLKSKLELEDDERVGGEVVDVALYCSPQRSFREKITDFFHGADSSFLNPVPFLEEATSDRTGSVTPPMPTLLPQEGRDGDNAILDLPPLTPPRLSTPELPEDGGSERSEGDSGKENEDAIAVIWRGSRGSLTSRGSRPRSGHLADINPGQQENLAKERGRVTRSSLGKIPLSLKSCERLQNEFNIAEGGHGNSQGAIQSPSSPPTPHKIIRVKEPGLCNPLQKLKQISLSPKNASGSRTKRSNINKRLANGSGGVVDAPSPASKAGKLAAAASSSHKVTEYFPIRRSERKPKGELLKEQMEGIEARLLSTDDSTLDIKIIPIENKGRGIVAVKDFVKGEFVVEYAGDLIDIENAKDREAKYSMDTSKGCYMYYFKHKGKQYCIDATGESGRYGRLLNHSTKAPNCATKVVMLGDTPRLILIAKQDIAANTELLYDYGDRSKESLKAHPWLAF